MSNFGAIVFTFSRKGALQIMFGYHHINGGVADTTEGNGWWFHPQSAAQAAGSVLHTSLTESPSPRFPDCADDWGEICSPSAWSSVFHPVTAAAPLLLLPFSFGFFCKHFCGCLRLMSIHLSDVYGFSIFHIKPTFQPKPFLMKRDDSLCLLVCFFVCFVCFFRFCPWRNTVDTDELCVIVCLSLNGWG